MVVWPAAELGWNVTVTFSGPVITTGMLPFGFNLPETPVKPSNTYPVEDTGVRLTGWPTE